jgi:polyphosphate kinase 2 (PPK2 family)
MLETVNLGQALPKAKYKARLPALRQRLGVLETECWKQHIGSLIVFEGWDGCATDECISPLTEKIDPRGFRLHSILAPRSYQQDMPWMYRFWMRVPEYGQIAFFNGSWYRRVLEERVEKIVSKAEWRQAYQEILDFERTLADNGYVIVKLFLHISRKEQGHRLKALEHDRRTQWRVRPEDWERHRKYKQFLQAAEDMLEKTHSDFAPWTIVEATDKYWARIKVFETVINALEQALTKPAIRKK